MYNSTLFNAFRNNQGLLAAQEQISSGKRINRPSDDPTGMMEVLSLRTRIGKSEQYLKVMGNARSILDTADSAVGQVNDQLKKAKELSIQAANATSDASTRKTLALSIDQILATVVQLGNTTVTGKYIFSGNKLNTPAINSNRDYAGSGTDYSLEISKGLTLPISAKASEFLTTDMNPSLSTSTTLASLNGGNGVTAGTFVVTNRVGATVTVNTSAMTTVGDVVSAISALANLTASISSDKTSITITDSSTSPTQALSVSDTATSQGLGINGTRNSSSFTGNELDPGVVSATLLSDLYAGNGLPLENFTIQNGATSAAITFAGTETTVGNLLTKLNSAGAGINATSYIDTDARKLAISSTVTTTVAFAFDNNAGVMAGKLGIGGGTNTIPVLEKLSASLKADDINGILASIDLLNSVMATSNSVRGIVGARANQVSVTQSIENNSVYDNTRIKSFVEDTDFLEAASQLSMLQSAYQATLKSAAAIIQPSLLNFLG